MVNLADAFLHHYECTKRNNTMKMLKRFSDIELYRLVCSNKLYYLRMLDMLLIYHIITLGLPMKVTHALCQASRAMYYLNDWSGTCQVPASDVDSCESQRELSANTFYKGFTVLVSPQFINETYDNCLKEVWFNTYKYFYYYCQTIFDVGSRIVHFV